MRVRIVLVLAALFAFAEGTNGADVEGEAPHRMDPVTRAMCAFAAGERPAESLASLGLPVLPAILAVLNSGEIVCSATRRPVTNDEAGLAK